MPPNNKIKLLRFVICIYVLASWTLPFAQRGMFDFVQQTDDKLMTGAKVFFFFSPRK